MDDIFLRGWENFVARTEGPLWFRFLLQPAVAAYFAIRAGLCDARCGRQGYLWLLLTRSEQRKLLMADAKKDVGKVFLAAACVDFVYQVIVVRGVFFLELVFTATVLALLPYVLLRGPVSRIAHYFERHDESQRGAR